MKYLLILLLLTITCSARVVDIVWDEPLPSVPPQTIAKYNVYEKVGNIVVKIGETSNGTTLGFRLNSVTDTTHIYYVTAVNSAGQESIPSNEITVLAPTDPPPPPAAPNPPRNARAFVSP